MNWSVDLSPFIGWPWFFAIAALAFVTALLVLWGGVRGRLLRVASLGLLVLALANPVLREEQRHALPNVVLVMVDKSASQNLAGRAEQTVRLRQALADKLAAVPNLEVRWAYSAAAGEAGGGGDVTEAGDGTLLFADLNRALSQIPSDRLAGVIMLTDGRIHDVPAKPEQLRLPAPLHAFITGRRGERDRRIEVLRAPRYGLVGSRGRARLRVLETGGPAAHGGGAQPGPPAEITIHRDGQPAETRVVRVGEVFEIDLPFPHAGSNIVEVEVRAQPGELTVANNRAVIVAQGVRENLRVLLVSGEPHPGERTWRNLLKSDAAVDLVHFTILRPPRKQDGTPIHQLSLIAFPTRELFSEKLEDFDLIIFDRYKRRGVLPLFYFDNIAQFVKRGGAVLVAAGTAFAGSRSLAQTPLAQILPAEPTGEMTEVPFKARRTTLGRLHPVTRTLSGAGEVGADGKAPTWGRWFRLIDAELKRGQMLMQGPGGKPLLVLDRFGEGRVALMLSDHAWLWARGYEGGGPFNTLFRRLAHWLMKEPDLEEESLRALGQKDRLLIERRTMQDKVAPVTVTTPTGESTTLTLRQIEPGLWRAQMRAPVAGIYRVQSGTRQAAAHVGRLSPREMSVVTATDRLLRPVAEATGGGVFWSPPPAADATANGKGKSAGNGLQLPRIAMLGSGKRLHGEGWLGLRERNAHVVQGVKLTPLASGLFALALVLALFSAMWFREGR